MAEQRQGTTTPQEAKYARTHHSEKKMVKNEGKKNDLDVWNHE